MPAIASVHPIRLYASVFGRAQAILEHNRKREVENKVLEMRVRMEEEGYDEEEIQAAEAEERERLREERGTEEPAGAEHDTHREAAQKEAENERLAKALGVDPNQKTEEVFDRELQERKKEERLAQKLESMKQEERARRQKEREQIRDRSGLLLLPRYLSSWNESFRLRARAGATRKRRVRGRAIPAAQRRKRKDPRRGKKGARKRNMPVARSARSRACRRLPPGIPFDLRRREMEAPRAT